MNSEEKSIIRRYFPLYKELVSKDIKLKYRRSFLGYVWSVLNPLLIMSIMAIVFSNMFRFNIANYPVYLIIGQTLWGFMTEATSKAMWAVLGNAALMKKTYVPKYVFVLSTVSSSFVNMLFSLAAMIIVFLIFGIAWSWNLLFIPVILLEVFVFSIGLGFFLAEVCVFFRDVQYIYNAFTTAWMYATPIFYPFEQLPPKFQRLVRWMNPMYSYITQFRTVVMQGVFPELKLVIFGVVVSLVMLVFGVWRFRHNQDRFILYI